MKKGEKPGLCVCVGGSRVFIPFGDGFQLGGYGEGRSETKGKKRWFESKRLKTKRWKKSQNKKKCGAASETLYLIEIGRSRRCVISLYIDKRV